MKYPNKYVVFDFETTGFSPINDKVLEIGAIKVVPGQPDTYFEALINWGVEIPLKITEITTITQEMADAGRNPVMAVSDFREFIFGFPLVGHNIYKFDMPFLEQLFQMEFTEYERMLGNFVDTALIVKAKKLGEDRYWNEAYYTFADRIMNTKAFGVKFNLGLCCEELGIKIDEAQHRAMADVKLTHELYRKLCLQ